MPPHVSEEMKTYSVIQRTDVPLHMGRVVFLLYRSSGMCRRVHLEAGRPKEGSYIIALPLCSKYSSLPFFVILKLYLTKDKAVSLSRNVVACKYFFFASWDSTALLFSG